MRNSRNLEAEIENAILTLRGERVLLDFHLAKFYGVTTKALNQAVARNRQRFPADFMFHLTVDELATWRSQIVTSNPAAKMGLRRAPYAFTEQGVAMLSSVLRSQRAINVNVQVIRTFVRVRKLVAANAELATRLNELERRIGKHDEQLVQIVRAIRQFMEPSPSQPRRRIGFHVPRDAPGEHSRNEKASRQRRQRRRAESGGET